MSFGVVKKQNLTYIKFTIIFVINNLKQTLKLNKCDDHVLTYIFSLIVDVRRL
jgi:hypothetical protein